MQILSALVLTFSLFITRPASAVSKYYGRGADWKTCVKDMSKRALTDMGWGQLETEGTPDWESGRRFFSGNWYYIALRNAKTLKKYQLTVFASYGGTVCQPSWLKSEPALLLTNEANRTLVSIGLFDRRDFILKPAQE